MIEDSVCLCATSQYRYTHAGMQDTKKTLEIYREFLYPRMRELGLKDLVEDNASPHNNDTIRQSHRDHGIRLVGYTANQEQKDEIRRLIELQTRSYRSVTHA